MNLPRPVVAVSLCATFAAIRNAAPLSHRVNVTSSASWLSGYPPPPKKKIILRGPKLCFAPRVRKVNWTGFAMCLLQTSASRFCCWFSESHFSVSWNHDFATRRPWNEDELREHAAKSPRPDTDREKKAIASDAVSRSIWSDGSARSGESFHPFRDSPLRWRRIRWHFIICGIPDNCSQNSRMCVSVDFWLGEPVEKHDDFNTEEERSRTMVWMKRQLQCCHWQSIRFYLISVSNTKMEKKNDKSFFQFQSLRSNVKKDKMDNGRMSNLDALIWGEASDWSEGKFSTMSMWFFFFPDKVRGWRYRLSKQIFQKKLVLYWKTNEQMVHRLEIIPDWSLLADTRAAAWQCCSSTVSVGWNPFGGVLSIGIVTEHQNYYKVVNKTKQTKRHPNQEVAHRHSGPRQTPWRVNCPHRLFPE